MDSAVGGPQGAERIHGRGDGVGDFLLVPHRAPARGSPHDVYSELCDPRAIVLARGLVAAEGEARWIPAVEPECGGAQPVGVVEQRLIEGHVLAARPTVRFHEQTPGERGGGLAVWRLGGWSRGHANRLTAQPPNRPPRTPPPAGTRTPGSGPRTLHPRGRRTAIPCVAASQVTGTPRAPASRAGPSG